MLISNFNFESYMLLPGCIVDEGVAYLPDPVEEGLRASPHNLSLLICT